eukprot:gene34753-42079_t
MFAVSDALRLHNANHRLFSTRAGSTTQDKSISWDSHKAVDEIPESLVKTIDGNQGIRKKVETLLRRSQLNICKAVEECDGKGKFKSDVWVRDS